MYMMHDAKGKIQVLQQLLSDPSKKMTAQKRFKVQLLLWIYVGVAEHQLNLTKLYNVSKTYKRIRVLPQGYMQAELYTRTAPTRTMTEL